MSRPSRRAAIATIRLAALALLLLTVLARHASAGTRIEVLAIGNNRSPFVASSAAVSSSLPALRFADDDAAAFFEFMSASATGGELLTLMDRDTQALYPKLVSVARVPSLAEVRAAVVRVGQRLAQYKREGHRSVVFIFFSGHGTVDEVGKPELALTDGGITQKVLYEEVLERLPADVIHLMVDACHAEAVVRPRDTEAQGVMVTASEGNAILAQSTLARYPNVGVILAAAGDSQAHEWDQLRQGVFTYELLSALRGGADVNQDGTLEYSEVTAFLSAANRGVDNPLARLSVVARAPDSDRRAPIIDATTFVRPKPARLTAIASRRGSVQLDDDTGRHLATIHAEPGFVVSLLVPSEHTIYLRAGDQETQFRARAGESVPFPSLRFVPSPARARGSLDEAVRRGLFAAEFGRGYYNGFVDQAPEFVPVELARSSKDAVAEVSSGAAAVDGSWMHHRTLELGLGLSNAIANDLSVSQGLRVASRADRRSGLRLSMDLLFASTSALREWRPQASVGWEWAAQFGPATGSFGLSAGGGLIVQDPDKKSTRSSFVAALTPLIGTSIRLGRGYSLWSQAELSCLFYTRDARTVASLSPALWLGASYGL
ncbi:MAG: caspase family protein [Polyangiaceae bacterium]